MSANENLNEATDGMGGQITIESDYVTNEKISHCFAGSGQ
jgi:hypothetical protein